MTGDEQALTGGNSTVVVRVGGAVHRATAPWTPAVHLLLRTLRGAGMDEVPEPLGFDAQGREVLTFLPGDVGGYPLPAWLWAPTILDDAAGLLRRLHDASASLVSKELTWGMPRTEPAEVICHNDFAPYNMTFTGGRVTGVFDFDAAAPGPRIRDLAYLAYRLVPLGEDAGVAMDVGERMTRLDRLIAAYGVPYARAEVLRAVAARLLELAAYTDGRHRETGDEMFAAHAAMYRRDAARAADLAEQHGG